MGFEFAWETPARLIAVASLVAMLALFVFSAFAVAHRMKTAAVALAIVAFAFMPLFQTRTALARRLFPDATDIVEERVGLHMLTHGDCAGFVAKTGKGSDDGAVCRVRVLSTRGRWVGPGAPPVFACETTEDAAVREWTFARGSTSDACETLL